MELTTYLARLEEIELEISHHENMIKQLKRERREELKLDRIDETEANRLYWETSASLVSINKSLGVGISLTKGSWIEARPFDTACARCGKIYKRFCISRSSRDDKRHFGKCGKCEERIQRIEERRLEEEGREAEEEALEIKRLASLPYGEYLLTEHWKETRKDKLSRVRYRCELCYANGSGKALHVHHKHYRTRGCEAPWDLTVLCEKCHAKFHDKEAAQ
jgi:hypothetical protein